MSPYEVGFAFHKIAIISSMDPVSATSPIPPEPVKYRQLPWLAAILSLLVLSIIAALAYQNFILRKQISSITPIPPISPTPSPDPNANWEVVIDTQIGISFKYPKDTFPYANSLQTTLDHSFFGFDVFNNNKRRDHRSLKEDDLALNLTVYKPAKTNIELYLSTIETANNTVITQPFPGVSGSYTKVNSIIDNEAKRAIIYSEPKNEYAEYDAILVDNNNNVAIIRLMTGSHSQRQKLLPLLTQILSTFKFLDNEITPTKEASYLPGKNWQKINNPTLGITLCLPPKWEFSKNGDSSLSGTIIFNRDPQYAPNVSSIMSIPYSNASRREAYFAFWKNDYPNADQTTSVNEVNINSHTALLANGPEDDTVIWSAGSKLWTANISGWNYTNPSKAAFLKDFYTMISCSF